MADLISNNSNYNSSNNDNDNIESEKLKLNEPLLDPLFSKATNILFNTGNIASSNHLKKRTITSINDEIIEYIQSVILNWVPTIDRLNISELKSIVCRNPEFYEKLDDSERDDVSISVKLFLRSFDSSLIENAIDTIINELNAKYIDTLVISLPDVIFNHKEINKNDILSLWTLIDNKIKSKQLLNTGVSDLDKNYLEQFLNILKENNLNLPILNQVNLSSCCKMPEDLVEYAKLNNIQLTTHNDPKEFLTETTLQKSLYSITHEYDAYGWQPLWLTRYTIILKGRGIVKSKGYLLNAQRDLKYTK